MSNIKTDFPWVLLGLRMVVEENKIKIGFDQAQFLLTLVLPVRSKRPSWHMLFSIFAFLSFLLCSLATYKPAALLLL